MLNDVVAVVLPDVSYQQYVSVCAHTVQQALHEGHKQMRRSWILKCSRYLARVQKACEYLTCSLPCSNTESTNQMPVDRHPGKTYCSFMVTSTIAIGNWLCVYSMVVNSG